MTSPTMLMHIVALSFDIIPVLSLHDHQFLLTSKVSTSPAVSLNMHQYGICYTSLVLDVVVGPLL